MNFLITFETYVSIILKFLSYPSMKPIAYSMSGVIILALLRIALYITSHSRVGCSSGHCNSCALLKNVSVKTQVFYQDSQKPGAWNMVVMATIMHGVTYLKLSLRGLADAPLLSPQRDVFASADAAVQV